MTILINQAINMPSTVKILTVEKADHAGCLYMHRVDTMGSRHDLAPENFLYIKYARKVLGRGIMGVR